MRAHTVLVLVVVLGLMTGCIAPGIEFVRVAASGNPVTLTEDYAGFTKVDVGSAFRVEINQSSEYGVEITIDENLRDYLDVRVEGDTLRIGLRPGLTFTSGPDQLNATIAMPALEALTLSGAARANVKGFESNEAFRAELSGASKLQGDLSAGDVQLEASGASNAGLQGEGDALKLEVSGASSVDLRQFMVNDADVRLSGASQAQVNMNGTLDADLSGASKLTYEGDVKLGRLETNGSSSIKPLTVVERPEVTGHTKKGAHCMTQCAPCILTDRRARPGQTLTVRDASSTKIVAP